MRYFARVEYDGTNFAGWQIQAKQRSRTVQEELGKAISTVARVDVKIVGAGRTDAGVHGRGQGIHFDIDNSIDLDRFQFSINSLLPFDISIYNLQPVATDFHARFNAIERHYKYYFLKRKSPLFAKRAFLLPHDVNCESLKDSAKMVLGNHDFSSFCSSNTNTENMFCNIFESSFSEEENFLVYSIKGNRFIYKMVRSLVGTFIDISRGKIKKNIKDIIECQDRTVAGQTAVAYGLVLEYVKYKEIDDE